MTDAVPRPYVPIKRLPELSNERLTEYVLFWTLRMEGFRAARDAVEKDDRSAFYTGYSGWWCSKYVSAGVLEQRRRYHEQPHAKPAK